MGVLIATLIRVNGGKVKPEEIFPHLAELERKVRKPQTAEQFAKQFAAWRAKSEKAVADLGKRTVR